MKRAITISLLFIFVFTTAPAFAEKEVLYWVAPMDPNYRSDSPGKSPMGMDLVPVYASDDEDEESDAEGDRATVRIPPETIQNIGVRVEKARRARFGDDIRSYGVVTENTRMQQDVSSRVAGWIEELKITAVGDEVRKGELLFTMYSPDLVSAQQDYIAALNTGARGRIKAAARRLKSLGVQNQVLAELKNRRSKLQNVPFYALTDGVVSKLNVRVGTYVKSGMQIAEIQDYSSVWINVSVAEKDLQFLTHDSMATIEFPNLGGVSRNGLIDYIYPTIDPVSRTGQVRLVLDNKDGRLKPGAYADVTFATQVAERLAVPGDAILKSSEGDFVVLAKGKGRFQPRKVKTGITSKGRTEIISGIKEGDDIVGSAQFLIDSESSLRGAFRKMEAPEQVTAKDVKGDENAGE